MKRYLVECKHPNGNLIGEGFQEYELFSEIMRYVGQLEREDHSHILFVTDRLKGTEMKLYIQPGQVTKIKVGNICLN